MIRYLYQLFNKFPATTRAHLKNIMRPITLQVRSLITFIKDLYIPIWTVRESDGFRVAYIGHNAVIPYLTHRIYGEKRYGELRCRIFIGSLKRELTRLSEESDLLISCLHRVYLRKYFSDNFIRIPLFVQQMLKLPDNREELILLIKTKGSQKDMNKIKRNNYTFEITRDFLMFKFFYEEFHRPFISLRHSAIDPHIESFENLRPIFEEGELIMIRQDNRYVSGILCRRRGKLYETICAGVYHGDQELVRNGVLAAEYFFSMLRAVDLGCKIIDFGRTRAFLNDGILHYKKKWNMETYIDNISTSDIGLHVCKLNEITSRFLERNPFISLSEDTLQGTIFLGDDTNITETELRSYLSNCRSKGVERIAVVLLSMRWSGKIGIIRQIGKAIAVDFRVIDCANYDGSNFSSFVKLSG